MLQFATSTPGSVHAGTSAIFNADNSPEAPSSGASPDPVNEVSAALDAGCQWIRLRTIPQEQTLTRIVDLCRDREAVLMIDDDAPLVEKLRTHGVHLTRWTRGEVIAVREALGPHAIVGVSCSDASQLNELRGLDVDYVVAYPPQDSSPVEFFTEWMERFNAIRHELTDGMVARITAHPVAGGLIPIELYPAVMATGVSGIELQQELLNPSLEAEEIKLALETLSAIH